MRPIQMVDLRQQYAKIKNEIDSAVIEVLESSMFIGGPQVNSFSRNLAQYLGARNVIPCANGTDALQIAMMALGLEPGDEVITPSFTYIATTEVSSIVKIETCFCRSRSRNFLHGSGCNKKSNHKKNKSDHSGAFIWPCD